MSLVHSFATWRAWFVRGLAAAMVLWRPLPLCAAVTVLHHFGPDTIGPWPEAGLTLIGDTLFGTTTYSGTGGGSIYSIRTDGANFATLRAFTATTRPTGPLTLVDGRLYGATQTRVYGIDPDGGNFTTSGIISNLNGELAALGTTLYGVRSGTGLTSVFSVETDGSNFQTLHTLSSVEGIDLRYGLIRVGDTLFGTAARSVADGGVFTGGTIFSLRTDGSNFQRLHVFVNGPGSGRTPNALTYADGRLYGSLQEEFEPPNIARGGPVFAIDPDGSNFEILRPRVGSLAGLTVVGDRLYGTTLSTVFSLNTDGSDYRVEHLFSGSDGSVLRGARLLPVGNRLYGVAARGGEHNGGTLFYLQIPEPSTFLLALLALGTMANTRRICPLQGFASRHRATQLLRIGVVVVVACGIDFRTSRAIAAPLNGHPQAFNNGNGPNGGAWSGVGTYSHEFAGDNLQGTVEWAVFGPGQFPFAVLNGWIPAPGQLNYVYQVINNGSEGIANFTVCCALDGISNGGAVALGGGNETPLYAAFVDPILASYQFAYYDDDLEQVVGTPVPAFTGRSVGLVLSSPRVPVSGVGDVTSFEGVLHPTIRPTIAIPGASLYVPPITPGDYDFDGDVDGRDFLIWQRAYGTSDSMADGDDSGTVGPEDLVIWQDHYGETAPPVAASISVPEPASLALGVMSLLAMVRRPRL
ncbi:MAG: hypothetical protein SH868_20435 [Bythopirellula sp.]|nr:hypothetical protein [Bythopirellula sp.]